MADVATNINGKVTSDGTRGRLKRVGGSKDSTSLLDNILTLPDGSKNGAGAHVGQKSSKEGLLLEIGVVVSKKSLRGGAKLDSNKLISTLLEAAEDGRDKSSLDSVRLDGNESSLFRHFVLGECVVETKKKVG